ncbi:MAG: DUF86 domain-containing protein [Actinomycetota bacterium]|nr:DUF86 domain-containing protein [Actinomycetota bacterium]
MLRLLLRRLTELGDFDEARLTSDWLPTLGAERILTLVVDLAVSINSHVSAAVLGESPPDYAESFTLAARAGMITGELAAALSPSVGTRNVLVHAYLDIDYAQVADAIPLAIEQYRDYVRQVATWLRDVAQEPS